MNSFIRTGTSGFMATLPMTAFMLSLLKELPFGEKKSAPPEQITKEALKKANLAPKTFLTKLTSVFTHFGFGSFAAFPYGMIKSRGPKNPLLKGSLYGLGVWAANYLVMLPLFKYPANAYRMSKKRNLVMIASHVVWGISLVYADRHMERVSKSTGLMPVASGNI